MKYDENILKSQLAALHDVTHYRLTSDNIPENICSDCCSDWVCPIHELSSMLLIMSGQTSDWPDGCLNGYIEDKHHPPYDSRALSQQLDLICESRKNDHLCHGCSGCPVIRTRTLMQLCESNTRSTPENKYLTQTPEIFRVRLDFSPNNMQIIAHIPMNKSVKLDDVWSEIYAWRDKFVKQHSEISKDLSLTPGNCILVDCTITPRKKFTLEIPANITDDQGTYIWNVMDTYFTNIKSWKVRT